MDRVKEAMFGKEKEEEKKKWKICQRTRSQKKNFRRKAKRRTETID